MFIRRSMHVPPPVEAVRVVLGDFFFVYVHPYLDGNGRMGRFLMTGVRRLAMDRRNGGDARRMPGGARRGERAPGHRPVHALPRRERDRIGAFASRIGPTRA